MHLSKDVTVSPTPPLTPVSFNFLSYLGQPAQSPSIDLSLCIVSVQRRDSDFATLTPASSVHLSKDVTVSLTTHTSMSEYAEAQQATADGLAALGLQVTLI